jgi:hypothetical protein
MGPGVTDVGSPSVSLEIPSGAGVMVIAPAALEPEYEGFTPMSQYMTIDLNMSAPETGSYYIAVYEASMGGRYALVTGYVEAYSLLEWITVPLMVITLLQWSGQNFVFILIPMFVPLLLGLIFLSLRQRTLLSSEQLPRLLGTLGSLMFLGSSLSFFSQMLYALTQAPANWTIIASLIFGSLPLLLAIVTLRTYRRDGWEQKRGKLLTLIIISLIAPFVWAGLYIGPVLVILSGLLPLMRPSQV